VKAPRDQVASRSLASFVSPAGLGPERIADVARGTTALA